LRTLGAVASERMQTQDVMREATPQDLAALRELERAAGAPFRGLGMDVSLPTTSHLASPS